MFNLDELSEEKKGKSILSIHKCQFVLSLFTCMFFAAIMILNHVPASTYLANAAYVKSTPAANGPTVNDPSLRVERVVSGELRIPTSMAFLGPNDILVLEKNKGTVDRIVNGKLLP